LVLRDYAQLRADNGQPFRLNVGNESHFIVHYDQTLLDDILNSSADMAPIGQLQLLQDLRLLAEGRQISYADVVPVLAPFAKSDSNVVADALYTVAGNLKKFVTPGEESEQHLRRFFDQLSKAQVARLGWLVQPTDSNDDQLMRPTVLSAALYAKNQAAIDAAHTLFQANQEKLITLPAAIRVLVLMNEVQNFGNAALYDQLLAAYRQTSDASYKNDLTAALTRTTDPELIATLIGKFEDASTIKPQDLRAWFRGLLANDKSQQATWDWIRNDWQWLEETVGGDMEFTTYITSIAAIFKTPERLAEFKAFFEPKLNTPGLTREITMDIKVIESRVALIEDQKAAVNETIAKHM